MANPFPGMNSYLEDPNEWGDVHHALLTCIRDALQPALPRAYAARLNLRVFIDERQPRIPDGLVLEKKVHATLAPYVAAPRQDVPPVEPLVVFLDAIEG